MRKQKIQSLIILLCWLSSFTFIQAQVDYFPPAGQWEKKEASAVGLNAKALERAISFALRNEYSGSRDLRQAILKGFSREPFHSLLGPTKKRGGPAGIIIKDGYWVASWGDTQRVDMTFSVTKSYLSTLAGLAVDQDLFQTNELVAKYVWDGTFKGDLANMGVYMWFISYSILDEDGAVQALDDKGSLVLIR